MGQEQTQFPMLYASSYCATTEDGGWANNVSFVKVNNLRVTVEEFMHHDCHDTDLMMYPLHEATTTNLDNNGILIARRTEIENFCYGEYNESTIESAFSNAQMQIYKILNENDMVAIPLSFNFYDGLIGNIIADKPRHFMSGKAIYLRKDVYDFFKSIFSRSYVDYSDEEYEFTFNLYRKVMKEKKDNKK